MPSDFDGGPTRQSLNSHRRLDHVLQDCHVRPQIKLLEHHPKLRPHAIDVCACVRLTLAARSQPKSDRLTIYVNFAGRGLLDVIEASEQRALSRAAPPNHREDGAFAKIKGNALQHFEQPEILMKIRDPYDDIVHVIDSILSYQIHA